MSIASFNCITCIFSTLPAIYQIDLYQTKERMHRSFQFCNFMIEKLQLHLDTIFSCSFADGTTAEEAPFS